MSYWTIEQARQAYNLPHWSDGYFDIDEQGHLRVRNVWDSEHPGVDLHSVARELREQGLPWPVLLRITDILEHRVETLAQAFDSAMQEQNYRGSYTPVYPIKVNQQRTVVEHLLHSKRLGLEAGSKPEMMAVLALAHEDGGTIICNGYKDREYIQLALIGQQLGHQVYLVVEKLSELELILEEALRMQLKPRLGVRVRLASIGKGKWQNTGGEKSKFGLLAAQVLQMIERLQQEGFADCLQLIHCHLGSQISNIHDIQNGMREVARYYAELRKLGIPVNKVDVGGGLGVDYEGTRSRSFCSMNYSMPEYARDVVYALWQVCQTEKLPQPDIITESGRAMTAHHAVLISNVIDTEVAPGLNGQSKPASDAPLVLQSLWETLENVSQRSALEAYHDALHWLREAQSMYNHGLLSLAGRAQAEGYYYAICRKVQPLLQASSRSHREVLDELNEKLTDKYFCNLSIFQSVPDIWAIQQIFPILPLQRLDEAPTRTAVLQDLTCDSDGAIQQYVNEQSIEPSLRVHAIDRDEDYLLGIFMVGAYQETLGDMHNLFGDTHAVNLQFTATGGYRLVEPEQGDSVDEVLAYVHFKPEALLKRYQEKLISAGLDADQQIHYLQLLEAGLNGYTYLED